MLSCILYRCDYNKYTMDYILSLSSSKRKLSSISDDITDAADVQTEQEMMDV